MAFISLTGFGDVHGIGGSAEYVAERSPAGNGSGWSTHGVTPPQEAIGFVGNTSGGGPRYVAYTDDLAKAIFSAWVPLTEDPRVADAVNLYLRDEMLVAGRGTYDLVTACPGCAAPLPLADKRFVPIIAGGSAALDHVIFQSFLRLTSDAPAQSPTCLTFGFGCVPWLYESVRGAVRLAGVLPDGSSAASSIAGRGVGPGYTTARPISADGSRIIFTGATTVPGPLYARIAGRTTVQLNASERVTPDTAQPATYWNASRDGSRVFFTSDEALTDDVVAGGTKLYMWARQPGSETQSLTVSATGGTFTLSAGGVTTPPLAHDVSAEELESALEGLAPIGAGNVGVNGGPGDASGSSPYSFAFTGDLAGVNVGELTADASALTGGASSATVATTSAVRNLTQLDLDGETDDGVGGTVEGVIGTSDAGDVVYFLARGQRVDGATLFGAGDVGFYRWDVGGIDYIGATSSFADDSVNLLDSSTAITVAPRQTQVTPDGGHLLFVSRLGNGLLSEHGGADADHGNCVGPTLGCQELYVYSAGTRELRCASCDPGGAPATADATARTITLTTGAAESATHSTRPLTDDGRFVFFNTVEPLVEEDVNGRVDAYQFDVASGAVRLLSSGTHPSDSFFMDASRDGRDVFFTTREQLVGWDDDDQNDLYDARIGGGFPEPPAPSPACVGDACQGAAVGGPVAASAGSAITAGAGNVRAAKRKRAARARAKKCKRGEVRKRVRVKVSERARVKANKRTRVKLKCVRRRGSRKAKRGRAGRNAQRRTRAASQRRAK